MASALAGWDGGMGGFFSAPAASAGVNGPAAMNYGGTRGTTGGQFAQGSPLSSMLQKFDLPTILAQILQAGPQPDQAQLTSSMSDIANQETVAKNDLRNRFSGMGRPLSSTEFASSESQLADTFARARDSARANATKSGLSTYQTQLNPLVALLNSAQSYWPPPQSTAY
jgi:hypothetical protein